MNKMSLEELNKVVPIIARSNVELEEEFDYFRIVSLGNNIYDKESKNTLFFFPHSTLEEEHDGWYPKNFDLRTKAKDIMYNNPRFTFVIEESMLESVDNINTKYIVIKDTNDAINKLFEYRKRKSNYKVVAVTGSVGKTTSVGLIESVLVQKYKVLRIYSKRITPIILKAYIINFLNENIDYVVLENSIYYHDHVKVLCELLPPDISCMLNISSSHLGVEDLKTLDDICIYKAEILKNTHVGIINKDDEYLSRLSLYNNGIFYNGKFLFNSNIESLKLVSLDNTKTSGNELIINEKTKVKPFILSNLSKIQYITAYEVGILTGLTPEEIEVGLNSYYPVEHRLEEKKAFHKDIIFDGDITGYERMQELSDLEYDKAYLVLRKVGSSEDPKRISKITEFFPKFAKVFIFDDIDYLEEIKNANNVEIVNNHKFMADLDGMIIYHYSGYYRVWDTFAEENLNFYDREKYPIIKEDSSKLEKME